MHTATTILLLINIVLTTVAKNNCKHTDRIIDYTDSVFKYKYDDYCKSLSFGIKQLKQDAQNHYVQHLALTYFSIAYTYYFKGDYVKANYYVQQQLRIAQHNKLYTLCSKGYSLLFLIANTKGNLTNTNTFLTQALKYAFLAKDSKALIYTYKEIAAHYSELGNYGLSLFYNNKALEIAKNINDTIEEKLIAFNKAGILYDLNEYQKAKIIYWRLLKDTSSFTTKEVRSMYANLSLVETFTNQFDSAAYFLNQAQLIANKYNDKADILSNHEILCNLLYTKGEYATALKKYENLLKIAKEERNNYLAIACTEGLAECYEATGDYKKAYAYFKKYVQLQQEEDAISVHQNLTKSLTKLNETQNRLSVVNKELQLKNVQTKLLNEQKSKQIQLFVFSSIVLMFIAICIGFFFKYKNEQQRNFSNQLLHQQKDSFKNMLNAIENERKRIAADLHDSLGQLIASVKLKLSVIEEDVNSESKYLLQDSINSLGKAADETRAIAYNLMPEALTKMGLKKAVEDLANKFSFQNKGIIVNVQIIGFEKLKKDNYLESNIYRIIQELFTNAIKHAQCTCIELYMEYTIEDVISLSFNDNGIGLPKVNAANSIEGLGLKTIATRVNLLNGEMNVNTAINKGTHYKFVFKV